MSRPRLIALLLLTASAVVAASWLRVWALATPAQVASADYTSTYVAATQWREGQSALLYDSHAQAVAAAPLGVRPQQFAGNRFVDPPLAAVVAAPFSLLSLDDSYRAWCLLQLLLVLAAVVVAARAAPWPKGLARSIPPAVSAVALAGSGTAVLMAQGQWDGFGALGLAAAYACWRRDRRGAGGAVLAATALLAKPHLALGLAAWALGRRDRRMLAGAAAGAGAVVAATILLAGPSALLAFLGAPAQASGVTPVRMLLSFTGLFASWLGDTPLTYVLAVAAGAAALAACVWLGARARRDGGALEVSLAAAAVLSLLAAPHLLGQDLALLAGPFIWTMASAASAEGAARWPGRATLVVLAGWIALNIAIRVDLGNYSAAPPGRVVPLVLLVAVAAGLGNRPRTLGGLSRSVG